MEWNSEAISNLMWSNVSTKKKKAPSRFDLNKQKSWISSILFPLKSKVFSQLHPHSLHLQESTRNNNKSYKWDKSFFINFYQINFISPPPDSEALQKKTKIGFWFLSKTAKHNTKGLLLSRGDLDIIFFYTLWCIRKSHSVRCVCPWSFAVSNNINFLDFSFIMHRTPNGEVRFVGKSIALWDLSNTIKI